MLSSLRPRLRSAAARCGALASRPAFRVWLLAGLFVLSLDAGLLAATGPWQDAIKNLCMAFFGPMGVGLSLIAIIIGGLMFAFGEGGSKSQIAGLIFGAGLVLQAPAFLNWLGLGAGKTLGC